MKSVCTAGTSWTATSCHFCRDAVSQRPSEVESLLSRRVHVDSITHMWNLGSQMFGLAAQSKAHISIVRVTYCYIKTHPNIEVWSSNLWTILRILWVKIHVEHRASTGKMRMTGGDSEDGASITWRCVWSHVAIWAGITLGSVDIVSPNTSHLLSLWLGLLKTQWLCSQRDCQESAGS